MRIGIVAPPYDDLRAHGTGGSAIAIITRALAQRLARRASVVIYSARRTTGRPESERDAAGVEYRSIPIAPEPYIHRLAMDLEPNFESGWFRLPYFASSLFYRGYAGKVAREAAASALDIVHVHSFSQFVPRIKKLAPRTRAVLHVHEDWLALLDRACIDARLRETDLVIAPSEHTTKRIRERFPVYADRCRVLPNGVDTVHFSPDPVGCGAGRSDGLRCLFVGRVSPEKGLHVVLDAFARIREARPRARLDIYGSKVPAPHNFFGGLSREPAMRSLAQFSTGTSVSRLRSSLIGNRREYFDALERRHGELFGRSVFFHGSASHRDLRQAYRGADLFILPSVCDEAFGMVLLEAMACGIPAVVSRAGGIVEPAASAGAAATVERNDPVALAQTVLRLAADPARRAAMGRKGREFASRGEFGWDQIAEQLFQYHEAVLHRP